jgi:hypothetical protein
MAFVPLLNCIYFSSTAGVEPDAHSGGCIRLYRISVLVRVIDRVAADAQNMSRKILPDGIFHFGAFQIESHMRMSFFLFFLPLSFIPQPFPFYSAAAFTNFSHDSSGMWLISWQPVVNRSLPKEKSRGTGM